MGPEAARSGKDGNERESRQGAARTGVSENPDRERRRRDNGRGHGEGLGRDWLLLGAGLVKAGGVRLERLGGGAGRWRRGAAPRMRTLRQEGAVARRCAGADRRRAVRERVRVKDRAGAMAMVRPGGFEAAQQQQQQQEMLSRQQERHYRLLAELQALVKALPR